LETVQQSQVSKLMRIPRVLRSRPVSADGLMQMFTVFHGN